MLPKYLEFPELFENSPCTSLGSPLPIFYLHLSTAASQDMGFEFKVPVWGAALSEQQS